MKWHLLVLGSCAFALSSCETGGLVTQGEFDPLVAPGSGRTAVATRSGYKPGAFVRTNMDNVAFFASRPKGDATAEKTLAGNTEMKVISDDGNYVKVELNSGEVGYVPNIQVTDQQESAGLGPAGSPNEIQLYPPAPDSVVPMVDPTAPPPPTVIDLLPSKGRGTPRGLFISRNDQASDCSAAFTAVKSGRSFGCSCTSA